MPLRSCSTLTLLVLALCLGASTQDFPTTCSDGSAPRFPGAATAIDTGTNNCQLPGIPNSTADRAQNKAKNNFCPRAESLTVNATFMQSLQNSAAPLVPVGAPPTSRAGLQKLGEGKLATFEGFVMIARQECKESVNCGTTVPNEDAFHDIHISLLEKPKTATTNECTSFVAEMVPHHRPAEWNSCNLDNIAKEKLRVRLTGQLFFDGSHVPCTAAGKPQGSNPKRMSLWEIHPIYSFEVCPSGTCETGGWQKLEDWSEASATCDSGACKPKPAAKKASAKKGGPTKKKGTMPK